MNLAVFVAREYGGVPLGAMRFEIICDLAQTAIDNLAPATLTAEPEEQPFQPKPQRQRQRQNRNNTGNKYKSVYRGGRNRRGRGICPNLHGQGSGRGNPPGHDQGNNRGGYIGRGGFSRGCGGGFRGGGRGGGFGCGNDGNNSFEQLNHDQVD